MVRSGSSPLARGLRDALLEAFPAIGIIPARAGFTRAWWVLSSAGADHPRSRGVYSRPGHSEGIPYGSSPLARGLRTPSPAATAAGGIIPARAGFTDASTRGNHAGAGSSPLARGLLVLPPPAVEETRIIPARAGFTDRSRRPHRAHRDHPRSRGVYPLVVALPEQIDGSSPLARGLPEKTTQGGGSSRIIPARAGFTALARTSSRAPTDHPRSRGVYTNDGTVAYQWSGSSPLARGLPCRR